MKSLVPAFKFVGIFVAIYVVGNLLYGFWIEQIRPQPDMATVWASQQTVGLLSLVEDSVHARINTMQPTVSILKAGVVVVNVFEGCNGINVMVVFVAFLVAYGGFWKKMVWFLPLGLVIIHIANLFRIAMLYIVAEHWEQYFYYIHKYLFTAGIYVIVFGLWWVWVRVTH